MNKLEQIKQPEQFITEQEVVNALDNWDIDNQEFNEILVKYVDQRHLEIDRIFEEFKINTENEIERKKFIDKEDLKLEIEIAKLYCQTKRYKKYGRDQLIETYDYLVEFSDLDLAEQINDFLCEQDKLKT